MMFSNVWYNHSIVCTQLNSITIELMDGTTIEYDDDFSDIMNQSLMEASTCSGEPRYKSPQI